MNFKMSNMHMRELQTFLFLVYGLILYDCMIGWILP